MILHKPFKISSRLMPALQIADGWISLDLSNHVSRDGRAIYDVWIDLPTGEYHITDLRSGVGGGSLVRGFSSLLAFLSAAGESFNYQQRTGGRPGENIDLFPPDVVRWVDEHSDEINMLQYEIDELGEGLIVEE